LVLIYLTAQKVLRLQYRMHPQILSFSNKMFYQDRVASSKDVEKRPAPKGFPWPSGSHVAIVDVAEGRESRHASSNSTLNKAEAKVCAAIAKGLSDVPLVAVITFYRAQVDELRSRCKGLRNVVVETVDAFQGKEADVVLISTVRSGSNVGFLSEARRINVALTRAMSGLIVVGSVKTIGSDPLLKMWLDHYMREGPNRVKVLSDADLKKEKKKK
jgi:superfamily I DNA and/or RNA helicase